MSLEEKGRGEFDIDGEKRQRRGGGRVITEAEIGVMQLQVEGHLDPPEAGQGKEGVSPEPPEAACPT